MADWLFPLAQVAGCIPADPDATPVHYALRRGTMKLGLYAARDLDRQTSHVQDEIYIIATGSGTFVKAGERRAFKALDAIFVEAGVEHRFEDYTPDFTTWVVFWGPQGGEESGPAA